MGATQVAQWHGSLSIQVMVSITAGRFLGPGTLEKGWVRPKQAWVGMVQGSGFRVQGSGFRVSCLLQTLWQPGLGFGRIIGLQGGTLTISPGHYSRV